MTIEASTSGFHVKETGYETQTGSGRKLRQPDTYWSWIVCAAGVASSIIILGCSYCFGIIFPFLLDEFNEGKSKTGEYLISRSNLPDPTQIFYGPAKGELQTRMRSGYECRSFIERAQVIVERGKCCLSKRLNGLKDLVSRPHCLYFKLRDRERSGYEI